MKRIIYTCFFLVFISCLQTNSDKEDTVNDTNQVFTDEIEVLESEEEGEIYFSTNEIEIMMDDSRQESLEMSFENVILYKLSDSLSADFNGDGIIDKAIYIKDNETSGIIIRHGYTNEEHRIGFGKEFAHLTDFNWVDYWGLVDDEETSETTFFEEGDVSGSRIVELHNTSIVIGADELGGGLITFRDGKYEWVHQTC